jgi:hypothetical protein
VVFFGAGWSLDVASYGLPSEDDLQLVLKASVPARGLMVVVSLTGQATVYEIGRALRGLADKIDP